MDLVELLISSFDFKVVRFWDMFDGVKPFEVEFSSVGNSIGGLALKFVRQFVGWKSSCSWCSMGDWEVVWLLFKGKQLFVLLLLLFDGCLAPSLENLCNLSQ
ncbi:hypothetical protein Droror1_Dr00019861, partial [Drosera rotundifolia]